MFQGKLYPHQEKALTEVLACMSTLINAGAEVDPQPVDTIKSMLGIKLETIGDVMSKAIGSMVENQKQKRRVA
jgi:hypothetical protein